jgi:hypothetical protein
MWKKWCVIGAAFLLACLVYTSVTRKEGMTQAPKAKNPEEVEKAIKAESQQVRDELNLRDYRTNFDEIIMETETWAQRKRLGLLTKPFTADTKLVEQFNSLSTFIANLNDAMAWADKN